MSGFSAAQDANLLRGYAGASSTISYYGPYYLGGEKFWVADVEPEGREYVLSETALLKDRSLSERVLAAHGTYLLASGSSGVWKYSEKPAKVALQAGGLVLGFVEKMVVPVAFNAEKLLLGSVAGFLLPPDAEKAALGTLDGAEEVAAMEIGLQQDELRMHLAGWDARLALEDVRSSRSYESAVEYSKKAGLVVSYSKGFSGSSVGLEEKAGLLVDSASGFSALVPLPPMFGDAGAIKEGFHAAITGGSEKAGAYGKSFCEKPWCTQN